MPNLTPYVKLKPHSPKYKDTLVLYSLDYAPRQTILRQRTYDESSSYPTPITPAFTDRIIYSTGTCKVPRARKFRPRHVDACYPNTPTASGISMRLVIVPYRPTDPKHNQQIKEIITYPNVAAASYFGEEIKTDALEFYKDYT